MFKIVYFLLKQTYIICRKDNTQMQSDETQSIETTNRAKLAKLAGFEIEQKLSQYVPKDTNFSLWLNVARSKM